MANEVIKSYEEKTQALTKVADSLNFAITELKSVQKMEDNAVKAFSEMIAIQTIEQSIPDALARSFSKLADTDYGFDTDKKQYDLSVYKNIMVSALRDGHTSFMDKKFAIIQAKYYRTEKGLRSLVSNLFSSKDDYYSVVSQFVKQEQSGGIYYGVMKISVKWKYQGKEESEEFERRVKGFKAFDYDVFNTKADRRGLDWLYNRITGCSVGIAEDAFDDEKINNSRKAKTANSMFSKPEPKQEQEPEVIQAEVVGGEVEIDELEQLVAKCSDCNIFIEELFLKMKECDKYKDGLDGETVEDMQKNPRRIKFALKNFKTIYENINS